MLLDNECPSSDCWKMSKSVGPIFWKKTQYCAVKASATTKNTIPLAIIYILFDYWRPPIAKSVCMETFLIKKEGCHDATFWVFWIFHGQHSVNCVHNIFWDLVNQFRKSNIHQRTPCFSYTITNQSDVLTKINIGSSTVLLLCY